jgi:uncharacterized cupin superfamily protein
MPMVTVKDIIIKKPSEDEIAQAKTFPIWECGVSEFDWDYTQTETCYILQGQVIVKDRPGDNKVSFSAGDMVIFPNGLSCVWKVKSPVRKHYKFE